jgi:hypothetical protein
MEVNRCAAEVWDSGLPVVASIPSAEELLDGQVRAEDIPVAEAEVSWTGDVVRQWMALAEEGTRVAEA